MKQYTCHHLKSHKIVLNTEEDVMMDSLIKRRGWYDAGYCFAYLPKWLEDGLRKDAKGLCNNFKKMRKVITKIEKLASQ